MAPTRDPDRSTGDRFTDDWSAGDRSEGDRSEDASHSLLVAADLDGTLVFDGGPPDPQMFDLVQELAIDPRIRLVLATSRSTRSLWVWFGPLVDQIDLLCYNGALHQQQGRVTWERPVPSDLVRLLAAELRSAGEPFCLDYGDHFRASAADALPWMGSEHRIVLSPEEIPIAQGVLKISVAHRSLWEGRITELADEHVQVYPHLSGDLDVVAAGVSKAAGLDKIIRAATGPTPVLAFGNDANDRDMLLMADRAVVVGQGLPCLEQLAHITRVVATTEAVSIKLRTAVEQAVLARSESSS